MRLLVACLLLMAAPAWAQTTTVVSVPLSMPAGTQAIAATAVPVGLTTVTAAISRALLSPTVTLSWSLELSQDGGTTWLPWGGAGTGGGGTALESSFTVAMDQPATANTRIRGSLTASEPVTTTATIRGTTAPLPAARRSALHHSVAFDNTQHVEGTTVATLTTTAFTITANTNRAAMLGLILNDNGHAFSSAACGGVSGAAITGTDSANTVAGQTMMAGVKNPASGSQTATFAWTFNTSGASVGVMTASGVDQTTTFNNGTFASGSSTTPSVTVTSNSGDLTMDTTWPSGADASPTQTQLWLDGTTTGGGGSRGAGGGNTTHAWTQSPSGSWVSSGANMIQAAGGGPVTPPERTKLGVGT